MASADPFPVIETERLVLREVTGSDATKLFEIHSDRKWMEWSGDEPPTEVVQTRNLIEAWAEWREASNPGVRWGLERARDSELIGTCGLFKWNQKWRSCSTSYELASGSSGMGYMSEAMTAVLDWGWEHMSLNRVDALVHPSNARSHELLQRLGFQREGLLREAAHWGGRYHDLVLMARLRK